MLKLLKTLRTFFWFLGRESPHPYEWRIGPRKAWALAVILEDFRRKASRHA